MINSSFLPSVIFLLLLFAIYEVLYVYIYQVESDFC